MLGHMIESKDSTIRLGDYSRRHSQDSASPFRYPGGKGFLTGYLSNCLQQLPSEARGYVEPFCGGAGAAINLLKDGACEEIHLNDLDSRVYSAWRAIVTETDRFLERLKGVAVDVSSWRQARETVSKSRGGYDFEVGFATFFLNRTSRAGIILGSGPIGGYDQTSAWGVDARFYLETMSKRIEWIGSKREHIFLTNLPALQFLNEHSANSSHRNLFYFIDPPYIVAGSRLYLNAMDLTSHRALSDFLQSGSLHHWVLTYDNDPLIWKLYARCQISELEVNYSLRKTRRAKEVLIRPS